jgi:PAS domain S-box-containing protein
MLPPRGQFARAILDALDSGLAIVGPDHLVTTWNHWLAAASGIPAAQAVGRTIEDIFPGARATRLISAIDTALGLGASSLLSHALHPQLLPLTTRAGRPLLHSVAVRPAGERPYFGCLIQVADVTLAVNREAVLKRRQNARYEAVVNGTPDAVLTFDADGVIQLANPAAAGEFACAEAELIGRRLEDFLENAEVWSEGLRILLSGRPVRWPLELVVRRADGAFSQDDAKASSWSSDARIFVTAILRNVDERRAAEAELRRLNETLELRVRERTADLERAHEQLRHSQKMDAIGQLTGGVAHDFNNLLTPILGGLDILQRRGMADARSERLVDGALQSAERAQALVQRLLAFARRQPLRTFAVDVAALIREMTDLLASTIGPRIRVVTHLPQDLPRVRADVNQLEMALLNLAVNARDAMVDGGVLTIGAATAQAASTSASLKPGPYVVLSVSDTGVGMDAETLSRATEPFFSTKGIGKGTGLGLSMIHGLAAQLGGTLELSSTPGVGTTVEIWLPEAAKGLEAAADAPADGEEAHSAGTVLLVDDEDLVRAATAQMLYGMGYSVIEARSGAEAIACLDDPRISLIVTDHLMPGVTGTEMAREAQTRGYTGAILILSGYANLEDIAPDLPRLMKPFREGQLSAAIAALPRSRRPRP